MPLYPSKVLQAKEHALTPYSSVVFSLDSHLSPSRSWERINRRELTKLYRVNIPNDNNTKGLKLLTYVVIDIIHYEYFLRKQINKLTRRNSTRRLE
jgi:hypothetical protein